MQFEKIPKSCVRQEFDYITSEPNFWNLVHDFDLVGVVWSQPTNISDSYFLRLLQDGSSARARGYGKMSYGENDECSTRLQPYYLSLLDHGALWRRNDGSVICTASPYGTKDGIAENFQKMKMEFRFPDSVKLRFLDDGYRFRSNGDFMILIYDEKVVG